MFSTRVNDTFSAEAEQDLIFRYYTISGLGSYTPEELATGAGTLVRTTAVPRYSEEGVYFPYYFDAFDTGIVPVLGQTYYYAVVVEDAAGNKSSAETQAWPGL